MSDNKHIDEKVNQLVGDILAYSTLHLEERIRLGLYQMFFYGAKTQLEDLKKEQEVEIDKIMKEMAVRYGESSK